MAIAIVNYNTRSELHACLTTIAADPPAEVVVLDNGSTDGSIEMVQGEFPWVRLHVSAVNGGYGAGANQAIRLCSAPTILLLNSDTRIAPGTLAALSDYLGRHPRAGLVGPRLLNPDGSLQPSCYPFPTPWNILLEESTLGRRLAAIPALRERSLRTWAHDRPRVVPWVLGAVLAIRREAFEAVGGFDESFFMYYEEVDLCYRLAAAGWEVHFAPVAEVVHVGGASTGQWRAAMLRRLFASTAHFYRRHYHPARLLALRLVVALTMLARMARDGLLRRGHTDERPAWRAILGDALAGWQAPATGAVPRVPAAVSATAPLGEGSPPPEQLLRRVDWRFLLPAPPPGGYPRVVLSGGAPGVGAHLRDTGFAQAVSPFLPELPEADLVALLHDAPLPLEAAVARLAPGGLLYLEVDRRRPGCRMLTPARMAARLEARGLTVTGRYAVRPHLDRAELYLPLDVPAALRWYVRTLYLAATPMQGLLEQALHLLTGLDSRRFAPLTPFYVLTAVAGGAPRPASWLAHPDLPAPLRGQPLRPMVLTDSGNRAAMLPFRVDGAQPVAVLKIPKRPNVNDRTENEQRTLRELRQALPAAMLPQVPQPLAILREGEILAGVESYLAGEAMLRSSGRWRAPLGRARRDLALAGEWLATFHTQVQVASLRWGDETAERWVERPLTDYAACFDLTPDEAHLFARMRAHAQRLEGQTIPLVWRHRDFNVWNVYRTPRGVAVIDWEGGRHGLALCDLIHFATHWHDTVAHLGPLPARLDGFRRLFLAPDPADPLATVVHETIGGYLRTLDLAPAFLPYLLAYTWIELALRRGMQQRDLGEQGASARAGNQFVDYVALLATHHATLFPVPKGRLT